MLSPSTSLSSPSSPTPWHRSPPPALPPRLLALALSFLADSPPSLAAASRVSRSWYGHVHFNSFVTWDPTRTCEKSDHVKLQHHHTPRSLLLARPRLACHRISSPLTAFGKLLALLQSNNPAAVVAGGRILVIDLEGVEEELYSEVPPTFLTTILTRCPSLTSLLLPSCSFLRPTSVRLLLQSGRTFSTLHTLSLRGCQALPPTNLLELLGVLPNLKRIDLSECYGVTGAVIEKALLQGRLGSSLEELGIEGVEVGDTTIHRISLHLPNLNTILLRRPGPRLTDSGVAYLALPPQQSAASTAPNSVVHLLPALPLRRVGLREIRNLTEESMFRLAHNCGASLVSLDLRGSGLPSPGSKIPPLFFTAQTLRVTLFNLPNLTHFHFSSRHIIRRSTPPSPAPPPPAEREHLEACAEAFARYCPSMAEITIDGVDDRTPGWCVAVLGWGLTRAANGKRMVKMLVERGDYESDHLLGLYATPEIQSIAPSPTSSSMEVFQRSKEVRPVPNVSPAGHVWCNRPVDENFLKGWDGWFGANAELMVRKSDA
ncbi:hypothetical protein M427DRAFT_58599 [Gonapodya prolifera JEL478]|uniref:F-box domain-containing protein n=1 Tax=Gonapodya prolifera (strain JEL478) TaxID=1344416 RepID=A0A139A9Z9_GONPJ|nr:hypothetical protein M427DRAFT_58599 [Gonapodya prolifera JEL478]|eukprot:KXS13560.1 hypothetical protein M427DRAFT_58599 [Gonapodya prolifera JEL478]